MTVIEEARERVIARKIWGIYCEEAIRSGQWDGGSLVKLAVIEIEAESLRNMQESEV